MSYKVTDIFYHCWQYTGFEPVRVLNLALEDENSTTPLSSLMVEFSKIDNRKNIFVYYEQLGCIQIGHTY